MATAIPNIIESEVAEWLIRSLVDDGSMQPQLGILIHLGGVLDLARLDRAVRLLMDEEPVLGCRFVEDAKKPYWERLDALDSLDPVPVLEVASVDAESAALAWIAREIDPCAGPQLTAHVFRAAIGDFLALKFNHVAVDGNSVKEGAYLLSDTYRRLEATPDYAPQPNTGARNVIPAAKSATFKQRLQFLKTPDLALPTDWGLPVTSRGRGHETQLVRRIGSEAVREIRAWGRTRGATINDVLLTAYFRALVGILRPPKDARTPIQQSCDFRPWMPVGQRTALSNVAGSWCMDVDSEEGDSFQALLGKVVDRTRAWKAGDAGVTTGLQMKVARRIPYKLMRARLQKRTTDELGESGYPTLTDIGVIDPRQLDFGDLSVEDALLLGPVAYPPGFILTASTFRDRLTLSVGFDRAALDGAIAEEILDRVVLELANALPNAWDTGLPL